MGRRVKTDSMFSLYHGEETSHLNWLFMLDSSGGGRHLTNAGYSAGAPSTAQKRDSAKCTNLVNAAGFGKRARYWSNDANIQSMTRTASPGADVAIFAAPYTLKVFIRPDTLAADRCLFSYGGVDNSAAANQQIAWKILTTGRQRALTEDGSGTDRNHDQSGGTVVQAGVLAMLHLVFTGTHFRFYINGDLIQAVALIAAPTSGTSATYHMGRDSKTAGTQRYVGAMRSFMIRTVAESDADILAQKALLGDAETDGTLTFADSTNVFAHWLGDEVADMADACDRGMHLCQSSTASDIVPGIALVNPLSFQGKYFPSTAAELVANIPPAPNALALQALLNAGTWTIALIARIGDGHTGDAGLVLVGSQPGSDASSSTNMMGFGLRTTSSFHYGHEYDTVGPTVIGVDAQIDLPGTFPEAMRHGVFHLVVRCQAGIVNVRLNKATIATTQTPALPMMIGSAAYLRYGNATDDTHWFGTIGPLVIDTRYWSDEEADNDYDLLFQDRDSSAPVIENVVYPEAPFDFLEFDAYDSLPGLGLTQVLIRLGNEGTLETGIREAAYDEGALRGRYLAGGSTRTGAGTQADPYHFKIRPAGGWPVLPAGVLHDLLPRFVDGDGNLQFGPA